MSALFFEQLNLPTPDFFLGVGSASHGVQTGRIMVEFERLSEKLDPDVVIVVGDVNSTLACALVAVKMGIRIAHVEAGLRSFDRTMPEEINRILTDQISDYLFTTERAAEKNLLREGLPKEKIHLVGNVMVDTLMKFREAAAHRSILQNVGLESREFVLVTLHRPSNVEEKKSLSEIWKCLLEISSLVPVLFPVHPRTRKKLEEFGLCPPESGLANIRITEPMGYLDFLRCMDNAAVMITDSGGIQEETTILGVPCVTVRENTERPITVSQSTNVVAGRNSERILLETKKALNATLGEIQPPELWDGGAARRLVDIIIANESRDA